MVPDILSQFVLSAAGTVAVRELVEVIRNALARRGIELAADDKDELAAEIEARADEIRGEESPEEASEATLHVVQQQTSGLQSEIDRLRPIAAREHWTGWLLSVLFSILFLVALILLLLGSTTEGIVSLVASIVPGFLSRMVRKREADFERRIDEITRDLRKSERLAEGLAVLVQVLPHVPEESRAGLTETFREQFFQR